MSSTTRSWIVVAGIGAVEALKDHGICRRNNALRSSLQQQAKDNIAKSHSHEAKRSFSSKSSSSSVSNNIRGRENMKQCEDSLRTVMYLSCWGPNN